MYLTVTVHPEIRKVITINDLKGILINDSLSENREKTAAIKRRLKIVQITNFMINLINYKLKYLNIIVKLF